MVVCAGKEKNKQTIRHLVFTNETVFVYLHIEISQGGLENQVGIGPNVHLDVANITVDSFLAEWRRFIEL